MFFCRVGCCQDREGGSRSHIYAKTSSHVVEGIRRRSAGSQMPNFANARTQDQPRIVHSCRGAEAWGREEIGAWMLAARRTWPGSGATSFTHPLPLSEATDSPVALLAAGAKLVPRHVSVIVEAESAQGLSNPNDETAGHEEGRESWRGAGVQPQEAHEHVFASQ